ncbi:hypothetical protein BS17DRAFT_809024 [Gyrodon lividus]|nr:hypothetical protein BS17DRAFT_809024 [Gyrodon lividus]
MSVSGESFQTPAYIGIIVEDILYAEKSDIFYAFFSSMMLFLITVWVGTQAIFGQNVWIQDIGYPGGPDQYWATCILNCYCVVIEPSILWVATLGLGIVVDWASSSPGGDLFTCLASTLALSYDYISVFLNTTVTCMVKKQLGNEYASAHFDVVSIIVESVLLYMLSGIAFLVSLGLESATSCISPQMLILRVIMGRAWNKNTGRPQRTTIKLSADGTNTTSRFYEESAAALHLQVLSNVYLPHSESQENIQLVRIACLS